MKYTEEVKTSVVEGQTWEITNKYPVLTPEEDGQVRREIGARLYDIFSKYADP